ncbi:MAG: carboxypeptidase-like regulatory domain-containing protein, partial [Saprospiraceae bacterium]
MKNTNDQFSFRIILSLIFGIIGLSQMVGQGVTTSQLSGVIKDANGLAIIGAIVKAEHVSSGTIYGTVTNESGRYYFQGLRVGGPYKVTSNFTGMKESMKENIFTYLGNTSVVNLEMKDAEIVLN